MSPKFSIVIPVYNVAPYLRECLDSLLSQTFTDWEAICADDGSTDDSSKILEEYARRDARFRVVHQRNQGVSVARNSAMSMARGDWIGFVDSDDLCLPNWLEAISCATEFAGCDFIRGSFSKFADVSNLPKARQLNTGQYTVHKNAVVGLWADVATLGYPWLMFVRREVVVRESIRFPKGIKIKEDAIFGLNALIHCRGGCSVEYAGYCYRERLTSAAHSKRKYMDCLLFQKAVIAAYEKLRRFHMKMSYNMGILKGTSDALWSDFTQWLLSGEHRSLDGEHELKELMRNSLKSGLVSTADERIRWRIIKFCIYPLGSWRMVRFFGRLIVICAAVKRKG